MPRRRKCRRWNAEEKRSICRETRAPGVSVAQVVRRHALNANLIFKWLKDRRFAPADGVEAAPVFLPVEIHGGDWAADDPDGADDGGRDGVGGGIAMAV